MRYAKRDVYAEVDGVRRLVAITGQPVRATFADLVDDSDTTTEPPARRKVESSIVPPEPPAPEPEQPAAEPVDYDKLTKAELEDQLGERGIEVPKGAKKAELVELAEES